MRYVAPQFHAGRVGHQLSTVWQARLVAELFGLQYAHAPFAEYQMLVEGGPSPVGLWNAFLGLGRGEIALSELKGRVGYVTYKPPPRIENIPTCFSYEETWRLLDGVPDNHVLVYDDLAMMDYHRVVKWQARGLVTAAAAAAVPGWFQRQLQSSPAYVATPRETSVDYYVAAYRRSPLQYESLPPTHRPPPVSWFNAALANVRLRYPNARATLYTQRRIGDESQLDPAWDVREVPDTYPATFEAFKDLVEADLTLTSTGSTATMLQMYRYGCRPTVNHATWNVFPGLNLDEIERGLP